MAAPLANMERQAFDRIKAKAAFQLTYKNETSYDAETVALLIAWLNEHYCGRNAYFGLLEEPGLDLGTFPAPEVDETFLFRQYQGIWSVAYVKRQPHHVIIYDGNSEHPSNCLHEDQPRTLRLQHLQHAVKGELAQLDIPDTVYISQHKIVSHASKAHSAIGCIAWAEAKFRCWPIDHNWEEFEHPCWIPAAEHCNEFADMTINGKVDWSDVLRERARRASVARLTGA
ncbi:hypothetical protein C8A05DRAFT_38982 [Staphylotrichum tortipilum]|uniref:Uncharacterized protein n=1 Tax=Staphylotrichum tortipilum TaxID=2831512 RepID=A0AAN6RPA9_9PEZI|nr:hypothetical protein C8A05DRAFT_38982 [Staphylotrichum longicolle]